MEKRKRWTNKTWMLGTSKLWYENIIKAIIYCFFYKSKNLKK